MCLFSWERKRVSEFVSVFGAINTVKNCVHSSCYLEYSIKWPLSIAARSDD